MFPIAGQTVGPIGLKFFVDTQEWRHRLNIWRGHSNPVTNCQVSWDFLYIYLNARVYRQIELLKGFQSVGQAIYRLEN